MSSRTYIELLRETSELICEATQVDDALLSTTAPTARTSLHPLLSEIRIRYTVLLTKLDLVYDQMLQPQKRLIVKRMLEACLGRLIEIKQDLVELHLSDFSYDDDEALQRLQVTPNDAEPIVPQFFIREKEDEINQRYQFIDDTLKKLGHEPPKPRPLILTEQQAILIIQRHERARQGRLRGQFMKEIKLLKEKSKDQKGEMSDAAATCIQKVWRGFLARRNTRIRKQKEQLLIGMELPPYSESKAIKAEEEIKVFRRELQKKRAKEYQEALIRIEEVLKAKNEVKMTEQIGDELRRWISEYFERTGKLPDLPSVDDGGSRAMFSRQGTAIDSELTKSSPISSKDSKKSKDNKEKKGNKSEEKGKDEIEDLKTYKCNGSAFLQDFVSANEDGVLRIDEFLQGFMKTQFFLKPHVFFIYYEIKLGFKHR